VYCAWSDDLRVIVISVAVEILRYKQIATGVCRRTISKDQQYALVPEDS